MTARTRLYPLAAVACVTAALVIAGPPASGATRVTASLPSVSALTPAVGPIASGSTVTIVGKNIGTASSVSFGSAQATGLDEVSASKLTVRAPAHTAGTVDVRVRTKTGLSAVVKADRFTFAATVKPVSDLAVTATKSTSVSLSWTDPTDAGFSAVLIRRAVGAIAPTKPTSGTPVATLSSTARTFVDSTVKPATTYSYSAFAADSWGATASPAHVIASTASLSWSAGMTLPVPVDGPNPWNLGQLQCFSATSCIGNATISPHLSQDAQSDWLATGENFAVTLDAQGWHTEALPMPVDTDPDGVGPMSCLDVQHCVEITTALQSGGSDGSQSVLVVETLSPSGWSSSVLPVSSAWSQFEITQLACPAVGRCIGIGRYFGQDGVTHLFSDTLSAGRWTLTNLPVPTPPGPNAVPSLNSLSCASASLCVAVGSDAGPSDHTYLGQPLVETLAAGVWKAQLLPTPAGQFDDGSLDEVRCSAGGQCSGFADFEDLSTNPGGVEHPFYYAETGGVWTPTALPALPADTRLDLGSMTCPQTGVCRGVGQTTSANGAAVILTLTGNAWTVSPPLTNPDEGSPLPISLACPSVATCYLTAQGSQFEPGVIETLANGVWMSKALSIGDAQAGLLRDSCPTSTSCSALGFYVDPHEQPHAFADTLAGGTWTRTDLPLPADPGDTHLVHEFVADHADIDCAAAGECDALTGYLYNPTVGPHIPADLTALSVLHAGKWTKATVPGALSAISCPAIGSCVALGSTLVDESAAAAADDPAVAETLTSGTWSRARVPLPTGMSSYQFTAIDCVAIGVCTAVAQGIDPVSGEKTIFADTLAGGKWTLTPFTIDSAFGDTERIDSVSCPAAQSCVAAGEYVDSDSRWSVDFVETLAAAKWTVTTLPQVERSEQGTAPERASVSCPASITSCHLVTAVDDGSYGRLGVAYTLADGAWTGSSVPVPPGGLGEDGLDAISCPSDTSCTAVGDAQVADAMLPWVLTLR
ncbi:IPT/TIG domain-containing protein [Jatrophihabitans sp.]|uniref:IPT/TIG domain-containing protein n=1 Tax=Jatrophihabitans sp. TaxID=1932789 RepID=UPI0030C7366E|nr:hypothetical protein [Jatrophihabitans sp.]